MLYLFGRLALSDSYYFNDDFHADERPENQAHNQLRPALAIAPHAAGAGREPHAQASTKKPAAESSNGLLVS